MNADGHTVRTVEGRTALVAFAVNDPAGFAAAARKGARGWVRGSLGGVYSGASVRLGLDGSVWSFDGQWGPDCGEVCHHGPDEGRARATLP